MGDATEREALMKKIIAAYSAVGIWIFLSGAVILYNKYLLAYSGFHYPITLTMWYVAITSVLGFLCCMPNDLNYLITFNWLNLQAYVLLRVISDWSY